ncbi:MAG TPA: MBL fold metallo-hydrolase [candidate division Zixibacteria bacterium]|nr:MBL fold metallo-hydrolase [candidate division Zixibacteria bacterium]
MKVLILGTGQDAGVPQIGCLCSNCQQSRINPSYIRLGPSIALLDKTESYCYIIDASPDIKQQIEIIRKEITSTKRNGALPISGIFLTHAHYGHCSGLWELGKECISERDLPVYCTVKMKSFLENNHPFNHLILDNNIIPKSQKIGEEKSIRDFKISSFEVPHRNEYTDTVGYIINRKKSLVYLPDLDFWTDEIIEIISEADIALIDGCFYSKNELPRRSLVPHPPIIESLELLRDTDTEIYFTHLNHTNKVLFEKSKERKETEKKGFKIAYDGLIIEI